MENEYILAMTDPRSSLALVGGKGAALSRLINAGLPVPGGFHVTTAAYRKFVAENGLQPRLLAALRTADPNQPETLETASQEIKAFFLQGEVPGEIAREIVQSYNELAQESLAVAVRSSATAEDLPDLSFAGQQETYLNIRGADAVIEAVKSCWASLWTARAIGYRLQHQVDQEAVSLAVVVQSLVDAEAAGVLFTANPVNGQRGEMVINAAWGLGEAIVGGLVSPDTIVVDRSTGEARQVEVADKAVMTVRTPTGTEEQPTPADKRQAPVLKPAEIAEIVRLGELIESQSGSPQDIEWCRANGRFYIVQSRPITTLPAEPEAAVEWKIPGGKGIYMRGSLIDLMPNPLSPLFITLSMPAIVKKGLDRIFTEWSNAESHMPDGYYVTINGYGYMGMNWSFSFWMWILFRMIPAMMKALKDVPTSWRVKVLPEYTSVTNRWKTTPLAQMETPQLWQGIQEISDAAMYYVASLLTGTMGSSGGAEMLFTNVYQKMIKKDGDPDTSAFLVGYNTQPIQAEKALYDLAHWLQPQAQLGAYILNTPSATVAHQISQPDASLPEGFAEFASRMRAYLEQFGHMIYDLDFVNPLPADDPAPMIETIKMYLRGQGSNPYERQAAAAEKRQQASAAMFTRSHGLKGWAFRKSLRMAQAMSEVREDALAGIGSGYPHLRRMLAELGRRLQAASVIKHAEDIYWLEKSEIDQVVDLLSQSKSAASLVERVAERQKAHESARKLTPPPMLPDRKKSIMGFQMDNYLPTDASLQVGNTLKGVAASAGKVTAPARVLHGPEDFEQMRPGEVLVANITTPAWTPLFAMAAAVVTDVGGPLSHGSIVAREYGIPAVLGTGVATRRIHSGQMLTVDGQAGMVTLK